MFFEIYIIGTDGDQAHFSIWWIETFFLKNDTNSKKYPQKSL